MSLSTNGTFMLNGVVIYTNNIFTGDGSSLTNLNASQLTTGTLPDARLSGNVVFQNSTNIITNLWVSLYPQPSSVGYNSAPVPRIYCMSSAFGYGLGYSYLTNEIYEMVTNSLPNYGVDWYEIDAGWSQRDTNTGALIVNSDWPVNGKQFCDWAKSLGIKLQFYTALTPTNSAFWTNGYPTTYGSAISTGHEVDDAATFAAWGASGVKFDQFGATMADSLLFSSALKSANGMFVQVTPNIGECFDIHWPLYLNARYAAAGQADPTIPFNFTNLYSHFVVEASALGLAYIKPGFYGEGVGWQINNSPQYLGSGYGIGFPKYYYPYPHHVSADMALMLCSEIQWPGANEPMYLSKDFLLAYRDPLVIPARTVATTITSDGMTNYTLVRQIGTFDNYNRCFMFLNASTNNQSFTITTTNLGIPPGVFTLSSPWSQSIETWATNSFTVSVPPTNDVVYSVKTGFMAPAITDGAYLTSMPYRLTDFLTKNNDSGGVYDKGTNITRGQIQTYDRILYGTDLAGNVPQINSSYYTNGITFGYNTNVTMSYTLGGAASTFSGAFGIQQRWNGGGGTNRLSLYADNSLLFQSGWITNNSMATNFNVSVVGANILKIVVDSSGVLESCLGNPQLGVTSTATTNVYYATLTSSFLVNSNFVGATKTNVSDLSLSLPSGDYELVFNGVASETGASGGGSAFTIASSSSATIWGGLLLYQDDITAPFIRYYSGTTSITIGVSDSAGKINDYLLTTKLSVPTATTISVSAASYNATTNYFNILPVTYLKATKLK